LESKCREILQEQPELEGKEVWKCPIRGSLEDMNPDLKK
jgi:hypothetical protein